MSFSKSSVSSSKPLNTPRKLTITDFLSDSFFLPFQARALGPSPSHIPRPSLYPGSVPLHNTFALLGTIPPISPIRAPPPLPPMDIYIYIRAHLLLCNHSAASEPPTLFGGMGFEGALTHYEVPWPHLRGGGSDPPVAGWSSIHHARRGGLKATPLLEPGKDTNAENRLLPHMSFLFYFIKYKMTLFLILFSIFLFSFCHYYIG